MVWGSTKARGMSMPFPATMPPSLKSMHASPRRTRSWCLILQPTFPTNSLPSIPPARVLQRPGRLQTFGENSLDTYMMFVSYLISFITPYMVFPHTLNPFIWTAKIIVMTTWRSPLLHIKVKFSFQAVHVNITQASSPPLLLESVLLLQGQSWVQRTSLPRPPPQPIP